MKYFCPLALVLATSASAHPALAAPPGPAVQEVIVVANRGPQAPERIGQPVSVLTTEDLRTQQAVIVSDILQRLPGVGVSRAGGVGGATAVRIRGAESDQTLVVIDGVRVNDPSLTGAGFNSANLLAGDLARIEVLRGVQSTLWGSQALGGVVNISTPEPLADLEASLRLEAGSERTHGVNAGLGGLTGPVSWRLAGSTYATDGVSSFRGGTEADGYQNRHLSGRARLSLGAVSSLDLRASWTHSRSAYDGFPAPAYNFADDREFGKTTEGFGYVGWNFALAGGRLKNRLALAVTDTDRKYLDPDQGNLALTFKAQGQVQRWEYQGVVDLPRHWQATFGAETERSSLRTLAPSAWDPNPAETRAHVRLDGLYLNLVGDPAPDLTLTLGGRRDRHETFGSADLGQAAIVWRPGQGHTFVRASLGQGFKAPSLYQLYSEYGNRSLEPETATGWDVGIEQRLAHLDARLSATWFQRSARNQIDFITCTYTSTTPLCAPGGNYRYGYYSNTNQTRTRGLELTGEAHAAGTGITANYTWTQARNATPGEDYDHALARRPEHMANLTLSHSLPGKLEAGLGLRYVGESFDDAGNTRRLKAYSLMDLRLSRQLNDQVELYGRIENLMGVSYESVANYGAPGREFYVGVRAGF